MEKRELPNSTLILVFGILSIVGCCCYGIAGIIFGIIALVMSKKAIEIYNSEPELYTGYQNVKTGRILAIVGLVLSILNTLATIGFLVFFGGLGAYQEAMEEMARQYGG